MAVHAYTLPPDLLARAQALESAHMAMYFGGTAWTLVVLWLLVRGRVGWRIARAAEQVTGRMTARFTARHDVDAAVSATRSPAWLQGLVVAPSWMLLLALIGLPLSLLSHTLNLRYHLSIESWGPWWVDWVESTLLTVLIGTLVLSGLYMLLRHTPRLAWLWFWLATLPFIVIGVYLAPLVIDPIFNQFTPLAAHNPELVEQLQRVVAKGGLHIPASRMFVMDASRRYTGMNAYVTGFGSSKRVVVWDTTLPKSEGGGAAASARALGPDDPGMTVDELLTIYGHEQGHYVLGHIWKGMLYSAALLFFFYWLAFRLLQRVILVRGQAWHIPENPASWASAGLILLIATALGFLAEPLGNGFSRMQEHAADVYGQEVIHGLVADPQQVTVRDFNRLGRIWLEDPAPDPFFVWWSYSHPPTGQRADFAAGYDPWKPGQKPRYFSR